MLALMNHWYWGRALVGPYTVITAWIYAAKEYGYKEFQVFMLAKDGKIVADNDNNTLTFTASDRYMDDVTGKPVHNHLVYHYTANDRLTAAILALSGLTDIVDGMIARRFCMISDLGKALDPIADKLTQIAMLGCLLSRFPRMAIPFFMLIAKEVLTGIFSLLAIRKTKVVYGAKWYGKITTVFLYGMMIIHVLWFDIPAYWSNALISVCLFCMVVSFTLYMSRNIQIIKQSNF